MQCIKHIDCLKLRPGRLALCLEIKLIDSFKLKYCLATPDQLIYMNKIIEEKFSLLLVLTSLLIMLKKF